MRVSKWGNSLAVRIPADIVEEMGLKEGDEVEFRCKGTGVVQVSTKNLDAIMRERLRSARGMIPNDFVFDREEANSRERD